MITIEQIQELKTNHEESFIKHPAKTLEKLSIEKENFPIPKALNVQFGTITYFEFEKLETVMILTPFAIHLMSKQNFNDYYGKLK